MVDGINRRQALTLFGATGAALALPRLWADSQPAVGPATDWPAPPDEDEPVEITLTARQRQQQLLPRPARPTPLWTLHNDWPPPLVRVQRGQRLRATLINELPGETEHTSLHWHGIRLPNAMDGVPYLTQPPVLPGERFTYEFTPPDAGTFFFHPHCNTVEQLGRGLAGVLLVTGDATRPFDADRVCMVKDWRLDEDGGWLPFSTDRGAGRAGTFGTVTSVNGAVAPQRQTLPAGGDVRLRVLNVDVTRILEIGVAGARAWVIAVDGNPVGPLPLESWRLGPAQRLDLALQAPAKPGQSIKLLNYFAAEPVLLADFTAQGPALERPLFRPAPLRPAAIPKPDLGRAETLRFDFGASSIASPIELPDGTLLPPADVLCLSDKTFWAINKRTWPEDGHQTLPPPLATLQLGKSYVFELVNRTPHMHPIHIHGHTFTVLDSNKRDLPRHHADTVLLTPKERMWVALVADNPGDWMFHCHIIEHQETGMMGIIRVA